LAARRGAGKRVAAEGAPSPRRVEPVYGKGDLEAMSGARADVNLKMFDTLGRLALHAANQLSGADNIATPPSTETAQAPAAPPCL
jgi:hypothetical protein